MGTKRQAFRGEWATPPPVAFHYKHPIPTITTSLTLDTVNNPILNDDDDTATTAAGEQQRPPSPTFESVTRVLRSLSLDEAGSVGLFITHATTHRDVHNRQCPERPSRIQKIVARLAKDDIPAIRLLCDGSNCRLATDEELLRIHTRGYLKKLHRLTVATTATLTTDGIPTESAATDEFDSVYMSPNSLVCAREAAGTALAAADAVLKGVVDGAACAIRPPGHHAEAFCAMGFCFFNNAALVARRALDDFGLQRVAIVDFDVHHGNGTQRLFWADERVLYISIHRWDDGGFYPYRQFESCSKAVGQPATPAEGKTVNVAFSGPKMGNLEYRAAWTHVVEPILNQFDPKLVICSAGFDAAQGDPLGGYCVTSTCFGEMTRRILMKHNGSEDEKRKCVLLLEGGYDLDATAESFAKCVAAMAAPIDSSLWVTKDASSWPSSQESTWSKVRDEAVQAINATIEAHTNHWLLYPVEHCKQDGGRTLVPIE